MKISALTLCFGLTSFFVLTYYSCKNASVKSPTTIGEAKIDSIQNKQAPELNPLLLKDFFLRYENLIQNNGLKQSPALDQHGIKTWKIEEIDQFFDPLYKYHLVDTLINSEKIIITLIAREYKNENIIWLCTYEPPGKLIQTDEVYYDNAEGNYLLESILKNDTLTLFSDDINEGKKTESFIFDSKFKLKQIIK